jgi:opacity protein-like surface antigen
MKKIFVFLTGAFLLLPLSLAAQEIHPKAEVFGGYSYLRTNVSDSFSPTPGGFFPNQDFNLNGWNGSFSGNLNSWLGLVGDVSGHYDTSEAARENLRVDSNVHMFLFGPRFTSRASSRFNPFVHTLFGVARGAFDPEGENNEIDNTKFAMALGGGLDIKLGDSFAIRAIQADYVLTRFGRDDNQHNARLGAGIVFSWK